MSKQIIFILLLVAPFLKANDFQYKCFNVLEGLPQSQVYDVLEGENGYLWLATRGGGLARFDGNDFVNYTMEDGLINNFLLSLFQDARKNIWVGTSHGVSSYNGIKFVNYPLSKSNAVAVSAIAEYKSQIILGTTNGVYVLKNGKFENVNKAWGIPSYIISSISILGNEIWIGHNKGVSKYNGKQSVNYSHSSGIDKPFIQTISLGKRTFIGSYGGGVYAFNGSRFESIESTAGLIVTKLLQEGNSLWITTQKQGVLKWNIKEERLYNLSDGLSSKNCRSIIKDSWGNYWIGTSGGGLNKYYSNQIKSYLPKDGIPGDYIYAIENSRDSSVWISTNALGLVNYKNDEFIHYGVQDGIFNLKYRTLLEDTKGNLWLGTEAEGVLFYDGEKSKIFNVSNLLNSNYIKDILEDEKGNIWVATSGGGINKLSLIDEEWRATYFSTRSENKIHNNRITCLHQDRKGRIWYGTRDKGIGCIEEEKFKLKISVKEGLSGTVVRSLTEDLDGNLQVAVAGSGVDLIDLYGRLKRTQTIGKKDGLSSTNIFSILSVGNKLYVGSDQGVDLLIFKNNKIVQFMNYGKEDGFIGVETTQNSALLDKHGNLWWGTIKGLMKKNGVDVLDRKDKPKLSLEGIQLYYNSLQKTDYSSNVGDWYSTLNKVEFEPNDNHIGFAFRGVDLNHPSNIKYQWKLDGIETNWSPLTTQNQILYSNLAPGDYTFNLRAVNKLGNISEKPKSISFTIKTPYYLSWWFFVIVFVFVVCSGLGVLKWRVTVAKRKLEEEKEKLELEKELLSLEQKALRLQMNPHFIFNALNSVQDLIRENNNTEARYSLSKFSKLMRNILDFSNEARISLEQEVKLLSDYLTIEQISKEDGFEFEIQVEDDIDDEVETIPPMLLQPFVENSIIHGLGHKVGGKVKIEFRTEGDFLRCIVEDNGIGREAAAKLKAQKTQQHKSKALEVTQARLTKINGENFKSFEMEDLEKDKQIKGTRISILVKRDFLY